MLAAIRMMVGLPPVLPLFVAATSATSSAFVTSVGVTIPPSAAVGNLLVLTGSMRGTQTFTTPSGWTLALSNNDSIQELRAWYRICQPGDAGSTVTLTIAGGGTEIPSAACLAYANISTSTPLFSSLGGGDSTSSTTWISGSLDCHSATTHSLCVLIWGSFSAGSHPLTMPAGITGRVDVSGASNSRMVAVADEVIPAGTLEAARTATPSPPGSSYVLARLAFAGVG